MREKERERRMMKEGMGDNGRKEFLSREKALSASGNFFSAK